MFLHKSEQSGVGVCGGALTFWCLSAQRSGHSGPEHSSWVTSLLLALQSLQVWFISPQREIISAVRFWFLKSYSILDDVNPVNINFKDPDAA
jgi:hypothetical protein